MPLTLLLWLLACGGPSAPDVPTAIEVARPLDESGSLSADALIAQIEHTHFPEAARLSPTNRSLFVALAARDTGAHEIAAAALEGMADSWPTTRRAPPPASEDYRLVTLTYLDHSEPLLQSRALDAARPLLERGDREAVPAVLAMAKRSDAHRSAVVLVSPLIPDDPPELDALYADALASDSPHTVAMALGALQSHRQSAGLGAAIAAHLDAEEPLLRGEAISALARHDSAAVDAVLETALSDPDPFVRSSAARVAGRRGQHLDALVRLLDDPSPNRAELVGFTRLDGREDRMERRIGTYGRVDHAAAEAIATFAGPALSLPPVRKDALEEDLPARLEAARTWAAAR